MKDSVTKSITIDAPVARVWRALTEYQEFGTWFGLRMEGPFEPGRPVYGQFMNAKYAHLRFSIQIDRLEPEHYFSFRWHPYAIDDAVDYSQEEPTLIEFTLEPSGKDSTRLRVCESGFSKLPPHRYADAFEMNIKGWEAQLRNIQAYVASNA